LLAFLNVTFFCSFFVVVLLAQFLFPSPFYTGELRAWIPFSDVWFIMIVGIFVFNLFLSAFVIVTLPGIMFFPLSTGFLVFRAVLWGLLFYPLPASLFLDALPTLILEGEAYVVAAVAGTVAGLSWIKPSWLFKGKELSRLEAFKMTLKEVIQLYKLVVLLLLAAAIVETIAILSL
jgi:hypothetical protein